MNALLASFPAPPTRGIDLPGPFYLAFYTLAIMLGIAAAVYVATRLWKSRGGHSDDVFSAMVWAVIVGIIGARVYHVVSSPDPYFGPEGDLMGTVQLWQGGLSIIGAVAAGSLGVWFFCRKNGIRFSAFADVIVPGLLIAQAIGRWGNWFNQELYGAPTTLPWGLSINTDQQHQALPPGASEATTFHPTFLYESLWNLLGFIALLWLFRRLKFKRGLLAWTYVAYYALGRFWVESLRIDEADKSTQYPLENLIGLDWRLNQIIAFLIFAVAIAMLIWLFSRRPSTEAQAAEEAEIYTEKRRQADADAWAIVQGSDAETDEAEASDEGGTEEEPPDDEVEEESSVSDNETKSVDSRPRTET